MPRSRGIPVLSFLALWLGTTSPVLARPTTEPYDYTPAESEVDVVGDPASALPAGKALNDTVWIADWSFDLPGGGCTDAGWTKVDNRILNDGSNYWIVDNRFAGTGGIVSKAAILTRHNLCWPVGTDGYGNDWDYSIVLKYKGAGATLSFNYLSDTEPHYDYVTVEADSAGVSEALVNYTFNPKAVPSEFRDELSSNAGLVNAGAVTNLALPSFGVPTTTHEAYIRFAADGVASDEDGLYPTFWGAALIVDNIAVTGGLAYTENFEGVLNANVTLANTSPATPFGEWARVYQHVTDNDKCTENTTCAWLWTDPTRLAFFPDMAFGPAAAVIRNWLDDIIVSPWVSLASTPAATGTSLMFRRFPGNRFSQSQIVQNWSVRAKIRTDNTDTPAPGDSFDCVSKWGHASQFNSLTSFTWGDALQGVGVPYDMTPNFDPRATDIQLYFRVVDRQYTVHSFPPATLNPGPGPYIDRVRIGRRVLSGPTINVGIDARTQAQDCFPTVQNSSTPGQHFSPDGSNRFGTCAFSEGADLATSTFNTPNLITGDSILLDNVVDARGAGGITSVKLYGAIVAGPHAGKAPAPYVVGSNGFFEVTADSARDAFSGSVVAGRWFIDLDDTYFRGGDVLQYFWAAQDGGGGFTSQPPGLTGSPASVAAAAMATSGLSEVNYLPKINWAPAYLARIAADANGDLNPTAPELAASTQANCILYYQHSNAARRSGDLNRTAFMYTLDRLGYRGQYDVYDVQGYGNTNNQLGGRANVGQASGYALIIEDDGRSSLVPNVPDGSNPQDAKVNQAQWYRNYLGQGLSGLAGTASLWVIGENTAFEKASNALFTVDMGLTGIANDQGLAVNPDVEGVASFTSANGNVANFIGDRFSLAGECLALRAYDAANAGGTAVRTHSYKSGATTGGGAIVMNKNAALKWNTIWQGFGWFDMRHSNVGPTGPDEEAVLATKIFAAVLPLGCIRAPSTDVPDPRIAVPRVTALFQNLPNPFNPTTVIRFDLARAGRVELRVFDVAGRLVKTLADAEFEAKAGYAVTWTGLDEGGRRVPSGIYFYRLVADDLTSTRKMIVLK